MARIGKRRRMVARGASPIALVAGLIVLAGAVAPQVAAARNPADPHSGHGQARASDVTSESAASPACAKVGNSGTAASAATADASVADFARLLHGTWVRRLTIGGVPVETNSFWYFDMSGLEAGRGQALMIDRVNQGWDDMDSVTGASVRRIEAAPPGGAEPEAPATTGAYWSVSIEPAPAIAASRGHKGVTLALAGDYRGTGAEYPPSGFRFVEAGTFYRDAAAYATLRPWRAPPMATEPAPATPATNAEGYTPVDAVLVQVGNSAGEAMRSGEPTSSAPDKTARPTLTFVICQDEIVDRYYKVSGATPTVQGKSLKAAWDSALASGMFQSVPTRRQD